MYHCKLVFALVAVLVAICISFAGAQDFRNDMIPKPVPHNAERNFDVQGQGGHQRGQGSDVYVHGQKELWRSDNNKHEVHGGASFGQHFGGPWGNSRPQVGVGAGYTYRWGR